MAVTGVNNYSNIYTNAYTGNIRKNNAKETTEKQVVEQTEDVKTGTTRKTAADELSYLSKNLTIIVLYQQIMLMCGKEANNQKQEIDRQHHTIPNQRPKDKHCGNVHNRLWNHG